MKPGLTLYRKNHPPCFRRRSKRHPASAPIPPSVKVEGSGVSSTSFMENSGTESWPLPVSMSLGDEVSVPVTCYNYLKLPQDVQISLAAGSWFTSQVQNLNLHLGPNEVKSVSVPITVLRVGNHTLRVTAQGTKTADAIEREVRVLPTGERFEYTKNVVLKDGFTDTFTVPAEAIPASQNLWVKLYVCAPCWQRVLLRLVRNSSPPSPSCSTARTSKPSASTKTTAT
jgi:hypothetical protein